MPTGAQRSQTASYRPPRLALLHTDSGPRVRVHDWPGRVWRSLALNFFFLACLAVNFSFRLDFRELRRSLAHAIV
jgi:hypothetical protein